MKTEQVTRHNQVVIDDDVVLSRSELIKFFVSDFEGAKKHDDGYAHFTIGEKEYCAVLYNITYLGIPHPLFKKRVQIKNSIKELFSMNLEKGIRTLLVGVYSYDGRRIYCDFHLDDYIGRKLHNSSAHVYTLDLKRAGEYGLISKTDFNGNHLIVFRDDCSSLFMEHLRTGISPESETTRVFDKFFMGLDTNWEGISCYTDMMNNGFPDARQAEWPGFYLEFKFNGFLNQHPSYKLLVEYRKDKKQDGIDLDLFMSQIQAYGDLKMHSSHSGGIQGNDIETVRRVIDDSRVWYVVCEHDTTKDRDCGYLVTRFWNTLLNKTDPLSYGEKMKHSVDLIKYYILEINEDNFQYVSEFKQGKNSDGGARQPKVMIKSRDIGNFLIHSSILRKS